MVVWMYFKDAYNVFKTTSYVSNFQFEHPWQLEEWQSGIPIFPTYCPTFWLSH